MIADKAKKSSLTTLSSIMDKVFPMVQTSLTQQEIFNMGAGMLSYKFDDTSGFPFEHTEMNHTSKGDIVVPNTLEKNVTKLHEFLFGEKNYQVSEDVKKRSETISGIAGGTVTETSDSVTATSEDYSGYDSSYDSGYSDYDGEDYDSGYSDYDSGDTNYDSGYTDNGGGDTGDYEGSGDTGGIEESSSEEME